MLSLISPASREEPAAGLRAEGVVAEDRFDGTTVLMCSSLSREGWEDAWLR